MLRDIAELVPPQSIVICLISSNHAIEFQPDLPDGAVAAAVAGGVAVGGVASSGGASAAFGVARMTSPGRRRGCGQSALAPWPAGWRCYCSWN